MMTPVTSVEREQLRWLVQQWNENRLDLFSLSEPDEHLEFHGVMRFYFQETGQKVSTKCIRVSSTATTRAVVEALVEKFHPDLKMLTNAQYSLWEIHEGVGNERRLAAEEKPLLVQLNWHKEDREGRFLLRRDGGDQYLPLSALKLNDSQSLVDIKRGTKRFSKREKRETKKRHQRELAELFDRPNEAEDVASRLYNEVPTTTFTRTISNPEIVMKKRRERQLESKLKHIGKGGSLKIYGSSLSSNKPYVTLLVSMTDRADKIVKETLDKYGLEREYSRAYCLVEVALPTMNGSKGGSLSHLAPVSERVMQDDECPLTVLSQRPDTETVIFHVRRRAVGNREELGHQQAQRAPSVSSLSSSAPVHLACANGSRAIEPFLVELNTDGSDLAGPPRIVPILPNVTEVGSDRALTQLRVQSIPLSGPYVHPRHCVLAFMDGLVTVTPCTPTAQIDINGQTIAQTTILRNACVVRIGRSHVFRFFERPPPGVSSVQVLARSQSHSSNLDLATTTAENNRSDGTEGQFETIFDVDGTIETVQSFGPKFGPEFDNHVAERVHVVQQIASQGRSSSRTATPTPHMRPSLTTNGPNCLPAIIELIDTVEDQFLNVVIRDSAMDQLEFKLSPAYAIYMACRYRLSPHYRTSLLPEQRASRLHHFVCKITNMLHIIVQDNCHSKDALTLWMANSSELLNFIKLDRDIGPMSSPEPKDSLGEVVERAFNHLTCCLRKELHAAMTQMLHDRLDDVQATGTCLQTLASAMSLMRYCRLNAALTIQLFSQLFHFINMYLFNWLVTTGQVVYCGRVWAERLLGRLANVQKWAERQGVEMAADCHLDRIAQALKLLQTEKTMDNLATLGATCYKLNSVQVRTLLERYQPEAGERPVTQDLIDNLCQLAEEQADESVQIEGGVVQLEEDFELNLPFLLPEDGYSPDAVRGIPPGLYSFVNQLQLRGLCRMLVQPASTGHWTIYLIGHVFDSQQEQSAFMNHQKRRPEMVQISFYKGSGGIGLSIVAAQGIGEREVGIYVKKVVPGSVACQDGRLESGDQLLSVNGQSLIGISQEEAAQRMAKSGPNVSFEVSKQAAMYNGLSNWLYQPSPQVMHVAPGDGRTFNYANAEQPTSNYCNTNGLIHTVQQPVHSSGSLQANRRQNSGYDQSFVRVPQQNAVGREPCAAQVRHNRSASASELYQNQMIGKENLVSEEDGTNVGSLPRWTQQQQQQQQIAQNDPLINNYHNLPSHYRVNGRSGPQSHQHTTTNHISSRAMPPLHSPSLINPSSNTSGHLPVQSNTHDARSHYTSSPYATKYGHAVQNYRTSPSNITTVTDYQNVSEIVPSRKVQQQQQQQHQHHQDFEAEKFRYGDVRCQGATVKTPTHGMEFGVPAAPQSIPNLHRLPSAEEYQQVEEGVLHLMETELKRLENKTDLTEAEDRRYRTLLYEVMYQNRLRDVDERRPSTDLHSPSVSGKMHSLPRAVLDELEQQVNSISVDKWQKEDNERQTNDDRHSRQPPQVPLKQKRGHFRAINEPENVLLQMQSSHLDAQQNDTSCYNNNNNNNNNNNKYNNNNTNNNNNKDEQQASSPKSASTESNRSSSSGGGTPLSTTADSKRYVFDQRTEMETEPRVQILGTQEVYPDPRQRREQQLHQQEQIRRKQVDGTRLGFKDKMKLFAAQIGEQTPKDRAKVSSAQRDIEEGQQLDHSH